MPTTISGAIQGKPASITNPLPVTTSIDGGTVYTVPPNTVTVSLIGDQTATTIITPTAGTKLQIIGVLMTSDASTFISTLEFKTSGITIQKHFEQGTLGSYIPTNLTGEVDEVVSFTVDNSTSKSWFLVINYAEVTP